MMLVVIALVLPAFGSAASSQVKPDGSVARTIIRPSMRSERDSLFAAGDDLAAVALLQESLGDFAQFKARFHRTYAEGSDEHTLREKIFKERTKAIAEHNQMGASFSRGVNQFTDRTDAELQRYLGYQRSHRSATEAAAAVSLLDTNRTMGYGHGGADDDADDNAAEMADDKGDSSGQACSGSGASCASNACCSGLSCSREASCKTCTKKATDHESFDWSASLPGAHTIMDQGGCGSCWAIAAAGAIETQAAQLNPPRQIRVSPQKMLECTPNERACGGTGGCDGATPELGFKWASTHGLKLQGQETYTASVSSNKVCPTTGTPTSNPVTISGFVHLPLNKAQPLMQALLCVGPVVGAAAASSWFSYSGGVLTCDSGSLTVDHAILIVGYGRDQTLHGNQYYWKIRNSWGHSFGENGFLRLARHPGKEPCGMDYDMQKGIGCKDEPKQGKVCGECGLLSDAAYPVGTKVAHGYGMGSF